MYEDLPKSMKTALLQDLDKKVLKLYKHRFFSFYHQREPITRIF